MLPYRKAARQERRFIVNSRDDSIDHKIYLEDPPATIQHFEQGEFLVKQMIVSQ